MTEGQIIHRSITIRIEPREDGGLRIWSDDIPGLILSHNDQEAVLMIMQRVAILEEEIAALNGEVRHDP